MMAMMERSSSSELPEALKEEILKRLPLESLCRCRSVCQEWNTLFTSTRFITTLWANFPSNKQPCLGLCYLNNVDPQNYCWTYCFSTRMWKSSFSLSFLEGKSSGSFCKGSATGLLLFDISYRQDPNLNLLVGNPLTGRSLMLPMLPSMFPSMRIVLAQGIVGGDFDGNRQTYKVVVVSAVYSQSGARQRNVEIFDSSEKNWMVATCIPDNISIKASKMVFSKGYFYCEAAFHSEELNIEGRPGIVGVSLQNENSIFAPFPGLANDNMRHYLVACRSRILLAKCVFEADPKFLKEVHIWELVKVKMGSHNYASWMEIAKMPASMCDDVSRIWPTEGLFEFVGVGDYVCFKGIRSMKVAVYSLTEKSWSWLPSCPLQNHIRVSDAAWIFPFEPRLDMKVN